MPTHPMLEYLWIVSAVTSAGLGGEWIFWREVAE